MPDVIFRFSIDNSVSPVSLEEFGITQVLWDSWSAESKDAILQNVAKQHLINVFGEQAFMTGKIKSTFEVVKKEVKIVKKVTIVYPEEEWSLEEWKGISSSEWSLLTDEQKQNLKENWVKEEVLDFSIAKLEIVYEEIE